MWQCAWLEKDVLKFPVILQGTSVGRNTWKRQTLLLPLPHVSDRYVDSWLIAKCHFYRSSFLFLFFSPYFYYHHCPEPNNSRKRVQGRHETGGSGPAKHHVYLHRHSGGLDGFAAAAAPGWVWQQKRLLASGGFLRDPAYRQLWKKRRHAAATTWWGHKHNHTWASLHFHTVMN